MCMYIFPGILAAQSIVLFISVALYVVQIGGELANKRHILLADYPRQSWMDMVPMRILIHFLGKGEYVLEFICLLCGIVFLYSYPGIAVLRCFRVFRLLWYELAADIACILNAIIILYFVCV